MAILSNFRDIFDTKLWMTKLWSAEFLEKCGKHSTSTDVNVQIVSCMVKEHPLNVVLEGRRALG